MTSPSFEFDAENPPAYSLSSLDWAIWTFVDRTGATNLTAAQLQARLRTHQRTIDSVVYHRPLAAAAEYVTRPDQMVKRQRNELTDEFINPFKVAEEWKALQAQLDTELPQPQASTEPSGSAGDLDLDFRGWGS